MILKELICKHTWEEIEPRLCSLYYDPKNKWLFIGEKLNTKQRKERISDLMESYHMVFDLLKIKRVRKPKDGKPMTIVVTKHETDYDGSALDYPWYNVCGVNGNTYFKDDDSFREEYQRQEKEGNVLDSYKKMVDEQISYALEFSSWCVWNGMIIDSKNIESFGEIDVIAHCLWELTLCSFREKDIKKLIGVLNKRVKSIKDGTAKFVSQEELREAVQERIKKANKKK